MTTGGWIDQSSNNHDVTFFNTPTVIINAINGNDAIRFDGVNQYGDTPAFARPQPFTIYIVSKQIVTSALLRMVDGSQNDFRALISTFTSNRYSVYAGTHLLGDFTTQTNYDIITGVYSGVNSENRLNNAVTNVGNAGIGVASGFTIASKGGNAGEYSNQEVANVILRTGGDSTAKQDRIINYYKARYAL